MTMKREKGRNGGDKNRCVGDGASLRTGMRNWKGRNGEGRSIKVKVKRCRLAGKSWCNPIVQVGRL